jgi:N utilization substance protein A
VTRVQITDPENKKLEVIVEDSQLSLAIGKKGQNVRLASKLITWDIDIKSEEEKRREIEAEMTRLTAPTTPLSALAGVGPKMIEKMEAAGITNLEQLAAMTPEQLMEIPGIGEKMVDKIYQAVNRFYEGGEAATAEGATEQEATEGTEGEGGETGEAKDAATAGEETATAGEEAATEGAEPEAGEGGEASEKKDAAAEETAEAAPETESEASNHDRAAEDHSAAAESPDKPAEQQEEKSS